MLLFEAAIGFISPASRTLSKQYVQQKEALNALKEDRLTGSEHFLELEASMNDLGAWMTGKHKLHIKEGYRSGHRRCHIEHFTIFHEVPERSVAARERIRHVALLWFNKGLAFSGSSCLILSYLVQITRIRRMWRCLPTARELNTSTSVSWDAKNRNLSGYIRIADSLYCFHTHGPTREVVRVLQPPSYPEF